MGNGWSEHPYRLRTASCLSASVSLLYYTRWERRQQHLEAGTKPNGTPTGVLTARAWHRHQQDAMRANPIATADAYLAHAALPSVRTFAAVATHFGVSTANVSYHVALVERLPGEFVEWLRAVQDPEVLRQLAERRLRPLTRIEDRSMQRQRLRALVAAACGRAITALVGAAD